ncbi:hypothetical protein EV426DRAFT_589116 [Tirmania nivea]|nr:hypothetical protein EV426DRAFT_589116 [Tirmania nivea]
MEIMGIPANLSRRCKSKPSTHRITEKPPEEDVEMYGFDSPWPLCSFALQLTSPIIKLVVGNNHIQFNVPQIILCKLPFFQAALQGQFREASEKIIKMPDDDPEIVSKMVEVLTRGEYSLPSIALEGTQTAETRLQCKLFHAQVYLLGEKYSCDALCEVASRFLQVLPITGKEKVLEYMVLVYEMTSSESKLRLPSRNGPHNWGAEKTRKLIAKLWSADGGNLAAHRKDGILGEVCKRCPELARDLLALVCRGE